ncbi:uncharacterized protein BXZ73DRAFT_19576, partial [Epithele typhae]|uniref:uncharacterized protein n=1 Tax=Epithele typhae TaxID=378194 RepID=UPI0020074F75
AQVLEIIPDVLPAHVFSLVEQHYPSFKEKVVESVLHLLFEDPGYPKIEAKGKGKRTHEDDDVTTSAGRSVKTRVDYGDKNRRAEKSAFYLDLAISQLEKDFPQTPTAYLRAILQDNNNLYAPAYLMLLERHNLAPLPFKRLSRPRTKGKGKARQRFDPELSAELRWIQGREEVHEVQRATEIPEEQAMLEEDSIECGCCFTDYPFSKMVQCPEAHLFCMSCMTTYAETKLGEHDAHIVCMDQSGCKLPFPDSELRRFLTPKLLELYERIQQRKEIEAAGLEGLEECPFCEYKVVIENEHERLFRCDNTECGAVTCRQCKKLDHLPKSCQAEVDDDKKLDARHTVEEAMTAALMRNCPRCKKAFVKEMGCNKMTCPHCRTLSCYVCRKVITGYEHFNNPQGGGRVDPKKCPLWDASGNVETRHNDEVAAAARRAAEEYKRAHPDVDERDLAVDLPPPPALPPPP